MGDGQQTVSTVININVLRISQQNKARCTIW